MKNNYRVLVRSTTYDQKSRDRRSADFIFIYIKNIFIYVDGITILERFERSIALSSSALWKLLFLKKNRIKKPWFCMCSARSKIPRFAFSCVAYIIGFI